MGIPRILAIARISAAEEKGQMINPFPENADVTEETVIGLGAWALNKLAQIGSDRKNSKGDS